MSEGRGGRNGDGLGDGGRSEREWLEELRSVEYGESKV